MSFNFPEITSELKNGFSRPVMRQTSKIVEKKRNWNLPDESFYRKNIWWFTIDDKDSPDLDDGIRAEKRKDGWYTLWVSITDVAEIVRPFTPIDQEALSRATSTYLSTHTEHMLPKELATDICSLNDQTTRKALTIEITLDDQFCITSSEIFESNFTNRFRFDYWELNKQLQTPDSKYFQQLQTLSEISSWLRKRRGGDEKIIISENWRGLYIPWRTGSYKHMWSSIIQELMLVANTQVAAYFVKKEIHWICLTLQL